MLGTYKRTDQAKRIVFDIETKDPFLKTKGVSWVHGLGHIVGISIKIDNEPAEYYPLRHEQGDNYDKEKVRQYLHSIPNSCYCIGHYSYYDYSWLYKELGWLHLGGKYRDTLLLSQLHDNSARSHSLDYMCKWLNLGEKSNIGDPEKIWTLLIETVAKYANHDVELTAKLDDKLKEYHNTDACERECQLIPILVLMKHRGIKIDVEQLDRVQKQLFESYHSVLKNLSIRDIWSGATVANLFRSLGISYPFTKLGNASFPNWFLEGVDHPEIQNLLRARKLQKLINTFCVGIRQNLGEDGRLHPDFFNGRSEDGGTVTGRLSCAHVNAQQIPNRTEEGLQIRSVFVPDNGIWYRFDYKQQEPMIMLHYASKLKLPDIERWKEIFSKPDADFYHPIQHMLSIDRFPAKTNTLAICYNMGYEKMARMLHIPETEAKEQIYRFKKSMPWLIQLKEFCVKRALEVGRIRTLGNRYLHFNNQTASDSFNHFIQGSAADQTKQAMINVYNKLGLVSLLQVHDDLNYDFSDQMYLDKMDDQIEEIMKNVFQLDFPVRIDKKMGANWKECN